MKNTLLLSVLLFSFFSVGAQATYISENFNYTCSAPYSIYTGAGWSQYNTTAMAGLEWQCTPLGGRASTPGIECNSYISGVFYPDTSWLFTPQLNLSSYTDKIFFRFDSRYEFFHPRLSILVSHSYTKNQNPDSMGMWTDLTTSAMPAIDPNVDSANWVTHSIDLTPFKGSPLYVAFRFISTNTSGGTWTVDNVMTTEAELNVKNIPTNNLSLTILGNSTRDKVSFTCDVNSSGEYDVVLYDNVGREVHREQIFANAGVEKVTLSGLNLHPGMYLLKVGNSTKYNIVKTVVE